MGYERVQEVDKLELASAGARGVAQGKEYAILTAEIACANFGVTPTEHSELKNLHLAKTGNALAII